MRISDWSSDVCSSDLHFRVDIRHGDRRPFAVQAKGNVTGAARHIEDLFVVARLQTADEQVFPEAVHSSRHGVIHQIISGRSEEHTSELQSLMRISYAVFCLKKKKKL